MLYQLKELEEIVETVFFTAAIRDAVPVSILLVSASGSAKSALVKQYLSDSFYVTDSFTSQGLWDIIKADEAKQSLRFIIVPDINPTLNRKPTTVQATVSNLLTLTYDGSVSISDGRQEKKCVHGPVGLISGVTPEVYEQHAKRWLFLGLRRRIIPLFYVYSRETISALQDMVSQNKIKSSLTEKKPFVLPKQRLSPKLSERESLLIQAESEAFAQMLGKYSYRDSDGKKLKWISRELVPVSPHLTLRTLAQARAAREDRGRVNKDDIAFLRKFLGYCDPEFPKII